MRLKVRLYGIDTPEYTQPFGTRARQFTAALVLQQEITVVIRGTDRYRRLVGEILLPDGRNLGQELLRAGLAWWSQRYAPRDTVLQQLEAEAQQATRGLWLAPSPTPAEVSLW
jgi:endonuclease YncB( thermonuclease family)